MVHTPDFPLECMTSKCKCQDGFFLRQKKQFTIYLFRWVIWAMGFPIPEDSFFALILACSHPGPHISMLHTQKNVAYLIFDANVQMYQK